MKLKHLRIGDYRHLKDLDFDFTYQSGKKKGQTLEKICFIGQSATGKTSILELIKSISIYENGTYVQAEYNDSLNRSGFTSSKYFFENKNNDSKIYSFSSEILNSKNFHNFERSLQPNKEIISISSINKDLIKINTLSNVDEPVMEFDKIDVWNAIFKPFISYQNEFLNVVSKNIGSGDTSQDAYQKIVDWKTNNPSPLDELSQKCLNPIFNKFNLEVDTKDTSSLIVLKPISKEKGVPANALSTGTKQILMTALPIFALSTENNIIMLDEPERSLYPDIQIGLMDYYRDLAPKAQFIVATHSPFIAAAFEPDERFILYFDNNGDVKVRRGSSPIGDDPNDMLKNDFDVNYYNQYGEAAYKKYIEMKENVASEKDPIKKRELLVETSKFGNIYNF